MRKKDKANCSKLLDVLSRAHGEILNDIKNGKVDEAMSLLESCQQGAISIGNIVESSEGEGLEIVTKLEEYCEFVYILHENLANGEENNLKNLEKKFKKTQTTIYALLDAIPEKNIFVFMPYKASMWDSLESIWEAANTDDSCEAYVVPIPYYDKNPDGSLAVEHYEIDQFPDYVPVINYQNFDIKKANPDVVFIINPYDEFNYVTTIHPDYYSYKLKELCGLLIYVPYYSLYTAGSNPKNMTSADRYVDYIIIQSEAYYDSYKLGYTKERMLPLGSPKFDRVIKIAQNPPRVDDSWVKKATGKKVYFYNTSLQEMINAPEDFLKKMEYVFRIFKENQDKACLLWRPHPLMDSTFTSMEPEYYKKYLEIKNNFIEEKIGIYDSTSDIETTMAFCDAYVGTSNSSVVALFFASGKEIFITDIKIHEKNSEDAYLRTASYVYSSFERYNTYAVVSGNQLYENTDYKGQLKLICGLPGKRYGYNQAIDYKDKIIVTPIWEKNVLVIDKATLKGHAINFGKEFDEKYPPFIGSFMENQYLFLYPNGYPDLIRIDMDTEEVISMSGVRDHAVTMRQKDDGDEERNMGGRAYYRGYLLFWANPMKEILKIDIKTMEYETIKVNINEDVVGLGALAWDRDRLYSVPAKGANVYAIDYKSGKIFKKYSLMIDGLKSIKRNTHDENDYYFSNFAELDENTIVAAPNWGNKFVQLDLKSAEVKEWKCDIDIVTEDVNSYLPNWGLGSFIRDGKDDGSYRFWYIPTRKNYSIDMHTGAVKEIPYHIDKADLASMEHGFTSEREYLPYCAVENEFNSLSDFINGTMIGNKHVKEAQLEDFKNYNVVTDGTAGENIYNYLKNLL